MSDSLPHLAQPRCNRKTRISSGLFLAFSLAVIADPISSVAYAIEAATRVLGGRLDLLLPTMGLVILVVGLVAVNYWQVIRRFPHGGGDPLAAARAFGLGWSFIPVGALVVDFALTIAISISAATSAMIAAAGQLDQYRLLIALAFLGLVAAATWFGHMGRVIFALMSGIFVLIALWILARGIVLPPVPPVAAPSTNEGHAGLASILMAFPVAMALATGIEASSTAIAQLGELDEAGKRRFGLGSLLMMVIIVGTLTIGLAYLAWHLGVGIPSKDSTQIADTAHAAVGTGLLFHAFQASSCLLLLAAASSSFQAGPGLLKALSGPPGQHGILPDCFGRTNARHTPYYGVIAYILVAGAVIIAAGALEQELVLFYAVAVFLSFLVGLAAMARFAWQGRQKLLLAINVMAIIAVTFTIIVNLARIYPVASLLATLAIAGLLYAMWLRAGKPENVENVGQGI